LTEQEESRTAGREKEEQERAGKEKIDGRGAEEGGSSKVCATRERRELWRETTRRISTCCPNSVFIFLQVCASATT
jgi:hypothetical protein